MTKKFTAIALVLLFAACDQAETRAHELKDKASEVAERLGDLTAGTKDEAQAKLEAELARLDAEFDRVVADAKQEGARGRDQLLAEIREQREKASAKLAELRAAGEQEWKRLCGEVAADLERLAEKCQSASEAH